MDPIVDIFFEEAAELLADYEAALLEFGDAHGDGALCNRVLRAAHTIKGNAAMLALDQIARFTHGLESLLDALRTGALAVSADVVDVFFFQAEDGIRDWSVTGVQTCALPI